MVDLLHGARAFIYPEPAELAAAESALLAATAGGKHLVVDVETTAFDLGDPRAKIRTVQLGTDDVVVVLDAGNDSSRNFAARIIAQALRLSAHNAAYDFVFLAYEGLVSDLRSTMERVDDTYLAAKIIRPPRGEKGAFYGLKDLAEAFGGSRAVSQCAKEELTAACRENSWGSLDPEAYGPSAWSRLDIRHPAFIAYAAADIIDGSILAQNLLPLVAATVSPAAWERERRLGTEAALMQLRGIAIDLDFIDERLAEQRQAFEQATAEIDAVLADLDFDATGHKPYSPEHLGAAAIEGEGMTTHRTATGALATGEDVLTEWEAAGSRLASPWLRRRKAEKLISTYYGRYRRTGGDRIHATLQTLEASTGRMSSRDPNFQNVPSDDLVRGCFLADPGYALISADFSSVEMRVSAALTGDPGLVEMYTTDPASVDDPRTLDPYWVLAFELYGPAATKAQRQAVKALVLGRMYGGGVATLAANQGISEARGREILGHYDSKYRSLAGWGKAAVRPRCHQGASWWTLPSGRPQAIDPSHHWKSLNVVVQGYSRDLLADAVLRVADDPLLGPGLIAPIHDEIIAQVPTDRAEEGLDRLVSLMSTHVSAAATVAVPAEGVLHGPRWTAK